MKSTRRSGRGFLKHGAAFAVSRWEARRLLRLRHRLRRNVMALHSPFATVMWDYINRGMPIGKEGMLQPDQVYALTAFLLYKNGVIHEDV